MSPEQVVLLRLAAERHRTVRLHLEPRVAPITAGSTAPITVRPAPLLASIVSVTDHEVVFIDRGTAPASGRYSSTTIRLADVAAVEDL